MIDDSKASDIEDSSLLVASSALVIVDLLNDPPQPLTLYILCSKPKSRPWTASMTSRIGTAESGYLSGSRIVSRAKSRENIKHFLGIIKIIKMKKKIEINQRQITIFLHFTLRNKTYNKASFVLHKLQSVGMILTTTL